MPNKPIDPETTTWFGQWATLNKDVELDPRFLEAMNSNDPCGYEAWQIMILRLMSRQGLPFS